MMRRAEHRAQPQGPGRARLTGIGPKRVDALRFARLACRPQREEQDRETELRLLVLERFARPWPSAGEMAGGLRGHHVANALVSFLFACTGPVALILTVGIAGGLKPAEIASWISIAFGLGGVITFAMSYFYRQPLAMAWTIPGTAIVGAGLLKFPYAEIVGAYVVTGALMLVLGLSGAFKKIMDWMPQPIVMAMVAGLFLKFGVLAIDGFDKAPIVAVAATAGFVLFSLVRSLGRFVPPVVAALAAGAIAIGALGGFAPREGAAGLFADPIFFVPKFSEAALLDLVLPLAISVVVLQNAQGIGILRMNGHNPPPNTITAVCGAGSIVFGLFGSVCTCLTGPANAIISSSGEPKNHYIGALIWAGFALLFGLFAPGITSVALAVPDAFIYVIGGLAMLRVLQQSLAAAFAGKFTAGAVVCMVITVTELIPEARFALLGIGAPFWGLVFGIAASLLLEPGDFRRPTAAEAPVVPELAPPEPAPAPAPVQSSDAPIPARAAAEIAASEVAAIAIAAAEAAPAEAPAADIDRSERPRPPVPAWALEPDKKPEPERAAAAAAAEAEPAPSPEAAPAAEISEPSAAAPPPEAAAPTPPPETALTDAVTKQLAPLRGPQSSPPKEPEGGGAKEEAAPADAAKDAPKEEPAKDAPPGEAVAPPAAKEEKPKKPKREKKASS
jgi:benzoate membrane transport protein